MLVEVNCQSTYLAAASWKPSTTYWGLFSVIFICLLVLPVEARSLFCGCEGAGLITRCAKSNGPIETFGPFGLNPVESVKASPIIGIHRWRSHAEGKNSVYGPEHLWATRSQPNSQRSHTPAGLSLRSGRAPPSISNLDLADWAFGFEAASSKFEVLLLGQLARFPSSPDLQRRASAEASPLSFAGSADGGVRGSQLFCLSEGPNSRHTVALSGYFLRSAFPVLPIVAAGTPTQTFSSHFVPHRHHIGNSRGSISAQGSSTQ